MATTAPSREELTSTLVVVGIVAAVVVFKGRDERRHPIRNELRRRRAAKRAGRSPLRLMMPTNDDYL